MRMADAASPVDVLGIGVGPSNLALAVAAQELDPARTMLFLERSESFQWHPGMMFDTARMQVSFLKDFATLRNPASAYTFLQYLKAQGRLEQFVNLRELYPTRVEYQDYMAWVAKAFAAQIRYGVRVTRVTSVAAEQGDLGAAAEGQPTLWRVDAVESGSGRPTSLLARNIVWAAGGDPRMPASWDRVSPAVLHASAFLLRFPEQFPMRDRPYEFAVAGDGQTAGEVAAYLLQHYPLATVHLVVAGATLRAVDSSPFVNERFNAASADAFFNAGPQERGEWLRELRDTNYGVVEPDLLHALYRCVYQDEVRGKRRLHIHSHARLTEVRPRGSGIRLDLMPRFGGSMQSLDCDGLVVATGYERRLDPTVFSEVLPSIPIEASGELPLTRHYRVRMAPVLSAGLYVQGYGEASFGPADSLLSLLPFRARDIMEDIRRRDGPAQSRRPPVHAAYPPRRHLENDPDKLFLVMERCAFATLISVLDGEPVVTQVPLTLDRTRGCSGVLFGHMDRSNPHAELLQDRRILALFHGPNAFISPRVYQTSQLPTWNSITVHARGTVRVIQDRQALLQGMCTLAERADPGPQGYRLSPEDPRIEPLMKHVVGFEIEIDELVGRFKLSQDRNEADRAQAALAMAMHSEVGERDLIRRVTGTQLPVASYGARPVP